MSSSVISTPPPSSHTPQTPSTPSSSTQFAQQFQQQTSISSNNLPSTAAATTHSTANNSAPAPIYTPEEKVYKKEKQILVEFDLKTKDLRNNLNDGLKCLEQRLDTQISIIYELQDFFKKRAEVEAQYSRDLDKLVKNIYAKHKSEKSKRETWNLFSSVKLWESLLNDTKQHSKYHQVLSDVCSKYIGEKCDEIIEDVKRIFTKCKSVGQASHNEIFKVIGELHGAMKTYHEYQSESKQAEAKLKYVQSQKPKIEKQKSQKKLKQYEKQVEKRQQKYTDTKIKAFKARNEYILSIDSVNACINKYCKEDIADLIDCMDFGFHSSIAKCIYMYISGQENIKRSRQTTMDVLSRSIGDLDSNADKQAYLDSNANVFNIQKKFQYEPYKGDEVSQVNAQVLIRHDMENRFEQLESRLKTLKTENDEIFKTIEATEQSLLNYFDLKNSDVSDLFRDLFLPNTNQNGFKERRLEIEDYYITKFSQYTISSNLIARLEARHAMMKKALSSPADRSLAAQQLQLLKEKPKKKIGKSPIIGQPRLFGGKLIEYLNATKQEIPLIITSCIRAIKCLGLHNQGIFRIPGSMAEINQFKDAFEKGEDPLITVNPREMNSVAGVLKLYFRELKDPLFPRDMFDAFANTMRATPDCEPVEQQEQQKIESLKKVVDTLPHQIYVVMRYLFAFLNHLSEFKDENMMDSYNIAVCMAPTLIPIPEDKKDHVNYQTEIIELIKLIIQNHDDIFCNESIQGPIYEKFEMDDDNDEIESEEEDESDKQLIRSISDDETNSIEAIALYDYNGRSEKEITFKKGDRLAIKGQLSADWWLGALTMSSTMNINHDSKYGYIPDKYIALKTRTRKGSNMSYESDFHHKAYNQLLKSKESDILNDTDDTNDSVFATSNGTPHSDLINIDKHKMTQIENALTSVLNDFNQLDESNYRGKSIKNNHSTPSTMRKNSQTPVKSLQATPNGTQINRSIKSRNNSNRYGIPVFTNIQNTPSPTAPTIPKAITTIIVSNNTNQIGLNNMNGSSLNTLQTNNNIHQNDEDDYVEPPDEEHVDTLSTATSSSSSATTAVPTTTSATVMTASVTSGTIPLLAIMNNLNEQQQQQSIENTITKQQANNSYTKISDRPDLVIDLPVNGTNSTTSSNNTPTQSVFNGNKDALNKSLEQIKNAIVNYTTSTPTQSLPMSVSSFNNLSSQQQQQQPTAITTITVSARSNSTSTAPQCSINNKSSPQTNVDTTSAINNIIKKLNNNNENETINILPSTSTTQQDQQESQSQSQQQQQSVLSKTTNKTTPKILLAQKAHSLSLTSSTSGDQQQPPNISSQSIDGMQTSITSLSTSPQQQLVATTTTSGDEAGGGSPQRVRRKPPPPVMKKLENKEEILRRLGVLQTDNSGNQTTNPNLTVKLSKSKATDV